VHSLVDTTQPRPHHHQVEYQIELSSMELSLSAVPSIEGKDYYVYSLLTNIDLNQFDLQHRLAYSSINYSHN